MKLRTRVVRVAREGEEFAVTDFGGGMHRARRVIVATGFAAT